MACALVAPMLLLNQLGVQSMIVIAPISLVA